MGLQDRHGLLSLFLLFLFGEILGLCSPGTCKITIVELYKKFDRNTAPCRLRHEGRWCVCLSVHIISGTA